MPSSTWSSALTLSLLLFPARSLHSVERLIKILAYPRTQTKFLITRESSDPMAHSPRVDETIRIRGYDGQDQILREFNGVPLIFVHPKSSNRAAITDTAAISPYGTDILLAGRLRVTLGNHSVTYGFLSVKTLEGEPAHVFTKGEQRIQLTDTVTFPLHMQDHPEAKFRVGAVNWSTDRLLVAVEAYSPEAGTLGIEFFSFNHDELADYFRISHAGQVYHVKDLSYVYDGTLAISLVFIEESKSTAVQMFVPTSGARILWQDRYGSTRRVEHLISTENMRDEIIFQGERSHAITTLIDGTLLVASRALYDSRSGELTFPNGPGFNQIVRTLGLNGDILLSSAPELSLSPNGSLFAGFYDERDQTMRYGIFDAGMGSVCTGILRNLYPHRDFRTGQPFPGIRALPKIHIPVKIREFATEAAMPWDH
jgi:hypothetical protein